MIGTPRRHEPECESTQSLLGPDDPEGAIATTDHQTGGRGRLGRRWIEAPGTSVLISVLLRPPPERRAAELTLVAGVATAVVVEHATGLAARIKWPNDVLLDGRKVSGGIAELRGDAVVLGIGLNVNQTQAQLPAATKAPAGSLRSITGVERDREAILADLLRELELRYDAWRRDGLVAVHDELKGRDFLRGRAVTIDGVEGIAETIDRQGRLVVSTASGPLAVESGEVLYDG